MFSKKLVRSTIRFRFFVIAVFCLLITGVGISTLLDNKTPSDEIKNTTVVVQGDTANTPDVLSVSPTDKQVSYSSPTFNASYEFNAIAPYWKEQDTTDSNRQVFIRTSPNGKSWSEWKLIEVMRPQRDDAPHADKVFPEAPIITLGKFFEYKVELKQEGDLYPKIEGMNVTYIDSRLNATRKLSMSLKSFFLPKADAANSTPNIISRAAWGSPDQDGNAFRGQDLYWPPTYKPTKQIFIHHTVDSNYSSQTDGASVVRAVWQYHAKTLGWGDIGYNYLVDQAGNTYQGRAHGDNVTGGHTFEYNQGSMAVALLGCFQPGNSTCEQLNNNSTGGPSSSMLDSLTNLLAWNTTNFEIDPQAQQTFCKSDGVTGCIGLYTIAGHRDANQTACPGELVYQNLQTIRSTTAAKKGNGFSYSAKQVNYPTVTLGDNSQVNVTLQFKNTGTATWYNNGANPINLATANSTDHASAFRGDNWINAARPTKLTESSVPPGCIGNFTFSIANPPDYLGESYEYFGLVSEWNTHFGNFFRVPIITRSYSYSYSSQHSYADNTKSTPLSLASLSPGQSAWLVLKVVNTSSVTWSNTGSRPITLGTDSPRDRLSRFCTSDWVACSRPTRLLESSVSPGGTGTFEFPITVPPGGGTFNEYFTPLIEGLTWMNYVGIHFPISVNGTYSWSYVNQQTFTDDTQTTPVDPSQLAKGQRFYFVVTARNNGTATWYNNGPNPLRLGTSRPLDRTSLFYDNAWVATTRPAALYESSVPPGGNGQFSGYYTAPSQVGSFKEYFQPVAEGITWLNDPGLYMPVTVR